MAPRSQRHYYMIDGYGRFDIKSNEDVPVRMHASLPPGIGFDITQQTVNMVTILLLLDEIKWNRHTQGFSSSLHTEFEEIADQMSVADGQHKLCIPSEPPLVSELTYKNETRLTDNHCHPIAHDDDTEITQVISLPKVRSASGDDESGYPDSLDWKAPFLPHIQTASSNVTILPPALHPTRTKQIRLRKLSHVGERSGDNRIPLDVIIMKDLVKESGRCNLPCSVPNKTSSDHGEKRVWYNHTTRPPEWYELSPSLC